MISLENARIKNPLMEFYRHTYSFSKRWDGKSSLENKRIILYCEQGNGDIIQFLRYIPNLTLHGCNIIVAAPKPIHPLLECIDGVDEVFEKQSSILPKHDYHILSLSLPFLLDIKDIDRSPYIHYKKVADLEEHKDSIKIGIAWEGSPDHPRNTDRCCPLKHFKILMEDNVKFFMLQNKICLENLLEDVDDNFPLYGIPINDFGDTASLINAMDFVVSVDTAALHLAGALGKRTYGVLGAEADPRWKVANWYDSVTLIQSDPWEVGFHMIKEGRMR